MADIHQLSLAATSETGDSFFLFILISPCNNKIELIEKIYLLYVTLSLGIF